MCDAKRAPSKTGASVTFCRYCMSVGKGRRRQRGGATITKSPCIRYVPILIYNLLGPDRLCRRHVSGYISCFEASLYGEHADQSHLGQHFARPIFGASAMVIPQPSRPYSNPPICGPVRVRKLDSEGGYVLGMYINALLIYA